MEEIVYLDSYLIINSIMIYLTISLLQIYPGIELKKTKKIFAALTGSALSLVSVINCDEYSVISILTIIISITTVCRICAGAVKIRRLISLSGLMLAYTFMMGGGIFLYQKCNCIFPVAVFSVFVTIKWSIKVANGYYKLNKYICDVCIMNNDTEIHTKGLMDTGNRLYDPIYGKPVIILSNDISTQIVTTESSFCCIPYRTAGSENGLMYGTRIDGMTVQLDGNQINIKNIICAFSNFQLSNEAEYKVLLHPDIIKIGE